MEAAHSVAAAAGDTAVRLFSSNSVEFYSFFSYLLSKFISLCVHAISIFGLSFHQPITGRLQKTWILTLSASHVWMVHLLELSLSLSFSKEKEIVSLSCL